MGTHYVSGSDLVRIAAMILAISSPSLIFAQDKEAQEEEEVETLETLEVIGVTPLHGVGLELNKIPSNVQTATGEQIEQAQSLDLTQFMNRSLQSVFINEAQNNPLQPDVQFRGFVASPLLGLPQGLSVYQNGVRVNEPFGETVNWALIPTDAIASINLIPGSNPLFGLNTLGGALSIRTKNGFTHPGRRGKIYGGSWERVVVQTEVGGNHGDVSYFLSGNFFDENGWRNHSDSDAQQAFANLGWRGERGNLDLDFTWANTNLVGNGAAPIQLLQRNRSAVYTRPDQTKNNPYWLANLNGTLQVTDDIVADVNAFYRNSDINTLNGDDSDFEECEEPENEGFVCAEAEGDDDNGDDDNGEEEEVAIDQNGNPIPVSEDVEGATINRTKTGQDSYGGSLQFTFLQDILGRENQFIFGGAVNRSDGNFKGSTELGSLDESRKAISSGSFVAQSFTRVHWDNDSYGVYFTDTFSVLPKLNLTVSGRYNNINIELRDQLGTDLDGDHDFDRFNPAAGMTYNFMPALNFYGGYSESNRAPSPVELTCSNPDAPCRLPNAFVSDPPLDQVVAKTWEVGMRGQWRDINWHLGYFRTTNDDDILFISSGPLTNQGFFDNVGETRRQGVELSLRGQSFKRRLDWFINYTYLDATFRDSFVVPSPNNPLATNGEIRVNSGDRIPSIPENLFKAGASFEVLPGLTIGGDLLYQSDQYFRGDEGNLDGTVGGFTVVNIRGEYRFHKHASLFVKVDNVFDERYETFGTFGEADEVLGPEFTDPSFLSPGAPRGAWGGLRFMLGSL